MLCVGNQMKALHQWCASMMRRRREISNTTWWRHQMEILSTWLAICAGNSPVSGEFPAQRPVTRILDVFFDLCLNKRLRKQSWGRWFETLLCPVWRNCNKFDCRSATMDTPSTNLQLRVPDSKVHGANMGPIWGRQDPGEPHVGPMNLAIWGSAVWGARRV